VKGKSLKDFLPLLNKMKFKSKEVKHILHKPQNPSNKGAILLPGISGGAMSSRYDRLANALQEAGFYFLRLDLWKSEAELVKLSIKDIHSFLDKAFDFMKGEGCTEINFIGKSFGGGVLLTYKNKLTKKMVLWAPAISFGKESNFSGAKEKKLSEFKHFMDIKINKSDTVDCPILVIHGTKDEIVPIKNSKEICKQLQNCNLERIEGAGHSYEKEGEMELVVEKAVGFLKDSLSQHNII